MPSLTRGALVAWQIAAIEARKASAGYIETEHIFIGVLSLDKVLSRGPGKNHSLVRVKDEWNALVRYLALAGHNPVVLRRLMRASLPPGDRQNDTAPLHRTSTCRTYFDRAAFFAEEGRISTNDLFSAIMERPGDRIPDVLAEARRCVAADRDSDVIFPHGMNFCFPDMSWDAILDNRKLAQEDLEYFILDLGEWSEDSDEYRNLHDLIRKTAHGITRLCLNDDTPEKLFKVLRLVKPVMKGSVKTIDTLISTFEAAYRNGPPSMELRKRIQDLLDRLFSDETENSDGSCF